MQNWAAIAWVLSPAQKSFSWHKLTYLVRVMINKSTVGIIWGAFPKMRYLATCCSAMPAVLTAKVTALGLPHCLSSPLHWRLTPALDCWHSPSQEYSSTFPAETAALRECSTGSQPGQLRLNTMWIPEVAVPFTWSIAVQVGAACEQLDEDFSISGGCRGDIITSKTQNPISLSDITKCHKFAP